MLALFATLSLLLVVASPIAAAPGGNSANAHACQKGGWESLARAEDPGTAFSNQGECVSYGAQGGTIVPYEPFVYNPVVTANMARDESGVYCGTQITATGFAPETTYDAYYLFGSEAIDAPDVKTDADGNWSGNSNSAAVGTQRSFQFFIDGVGSNIIPSYAC